MNTKVMRSTVMDFIALKKTPDKLMFCSKGFSKVDEESGVKISEEAFISDTNASPSIDSYARKFTYEASLYIGTGDGLKEIEAIQALVNTSVYAQKGNEAEFYFYRTEPSLDKAQGKTGLTDIPCRQFLVANENAGVTGSALEAMKTTGTLHQVGDFVNGKLTITNGTATFTPNAAVAPSKNATRNEI